MLMSMASSLQCSAVSIRNAQQAIPVLKRAIALLTAPAPLSAQFLAQPTLVLNEWIRVRQTQWCAYRDMLDRLFCGVLLVNKRLVTLLDLAAGRGHVAVCRWIMAAKEPCAVSAMVQVAAQFGLLHALRFLTNNGTNLDGVREDFCRAVTFAAAEDHLDVLCLFWKWGLEIESMLHALTAAASHGNTDILHFLKDECRVTATQVRSRGLCKNSPLYMAAFHDQVHVLKTLRDLWGLTTQDALDWNHHDVCLAVCCRNLKVCQFFEAWGRFTQGTGQPLVIDRDLVAAFDNAAMWANRPSSGKDEDVNMCLWVLRVAGQNGVPARERMLILALEHNLPHAIQFLRALNQ